MSEHSAAGGAVISTPCVAIDRSSTVEDTSDAGGNGIGQPGQRDRNSYEEAALIADLKAGSEEAFALLIAQYHQPIYSLIARSLNDPADAGDISQEVFIKVFRSIRGFHGDCSLRTWLYRIALREASNQRRWWSRHKRQEITIDSPPNGSAEDNEPSLASVLADHSSTPYEVAAQNELRQRVEAALREVPEAFRTVVVLREIEGLAYEEIAEILDTNLGTVKSRLTRGRAVLRLLLAASDRPEPAHHTRSTFQERAAR